MISHIRFMKYLLIVAVSSVFLLPLTVKASLLVSYNAQTRGLSTFDENTFSQTSGTTSGTFSAGFSLTFDQSGRLFGINQGSVVLQEFDPVSLIVIHQSTLAGHDGLAVIPTIPEPSITILCVTASLTFLLRRNRQPSAADWRQRKD